MRRAFAVACFAMKVVAVASVMAGGALPGAAAARPWMAGVGGGRGHPRGAGFALLVWHLALASAWIWQQVGALVWRRVWVAAWWWSWVVAGFCVPALRRVWDLAQLRAQSSLGCAAALLCQ